MRSEKLWNEPMNPAPSMLIVIMSFISALPICLPLVAFQRSPRHSLRRVQLGIVIAATEPNRDCSRSGDTALRITDYRDLVVCIAVLLMGRQAIPPLKVHHLPGTGLGPSLSIDHLPV
jgi:hypothetical protein